MVQGDALSLTSIVSVLPIIRKGLQSLNINFGRVFVSKSALFGHWGDPIYRPIWLDHNPSNRGRRAQIVG